MKRTMIFLDEEQHHALKTEARTRGRSMAELVREAVSSYLSRRKKARRDLSIIGMFAGPRGDNASERVDELISADFRDSR